MEGVEARKAAGDAAFRSKQFDAAETAYSEALRLSEDLQRPDLLCALHSNRSAARLALRDFKGALLDAQASLAVDSTWAKGHYRSAKALQGLGQLNLAVQAATSALQLDRTNQDVCRLLLQLKEQQAAEAGAASGQAQQQQQPEQQQAGKTWQQLNDLRAQLDLRLLPAQLVVGSRFIPSRDGSNCNLLLLLHGLGDTPAAFTALAERMQLPQTASLALSGPLLLPETDGGRAWCMAFDADGNLIVPTRSETRRTASMAHSQQLLQKLLFEALPAAGGWRPAEVQLLGFSQGGTAALELARSCKGSRRLGGVVAVSAALLEEQLMEEASSSQPSSSTQQAAATDVLITHGDRDAVVSRQAVDKSVAALQAAGCAVQLVSLPGKGHAMMSSAEETRAVMQFWGQRLRARPADPDLVEM